MPNASYPCHKCNGTGFVAFRHIENGVCFTCAGSGQLSYRKREKAFVDPHPELLVPEAERATENQWNYLVRLTQDNDDTFRRFVRQAGAPMASQRYVTRAVMSRAIEMAKGGA
jgi:RecJ-like exonuclease